MKKLKEAQDSEDNTSPEKMAKAKWPVLQLPSFFASSPDTPAAQPEAPLYALLGSSPLPLVAYAIDKPPA